MRWFDSTPNKNGEPDPRSRGCTALAKRDNRAAAKSQLKDAGWYFGKAYVWVAFLTIAANLLPVLPAWALPIVFLAYALPAVIGTMYCVVANRLHKQDLFTEYGNLARYNRRWLVLLGFFFILHLASALLFALRAPSWNIREWILIWASPIAFFVVFRVVQSACKKEYDAKYYKAKAVRWGIIATALALTIAVVAVSLQPPSGLQIDLHQIIQNRALPYADSPTPLLAELDKLSTYANCLTEYGIDLISSTSYATFIVVNMVLSFPVFTGVVGQLGACLLDRDEIINEFRLLPASDKAREAIQKRYFVMLAAIWLVLSGAFAYANHVTGEIRATEQYTITDRWINDTTEWAILVAEQDINEVKKDVELVEEAQSFNDLFAAKRDSFIDEQRPETIKRVNDYYDACASNVDAYVEWYGGILESAGRLLPIIGENMVRDEFDRQIVAPVSDEDLESQYESYLGGLESLYDEYWSAEETSAVPYQAAVPSASDRVGQVGIPDHLGLWADWNSEEGKRVVQEVLLGRGADENDAKTRILSYIEDQRKKTIEFVESMSVRLFPSSVADGAE